MIKENYNFGLKECYICAKSFCEQNLYCGYCEKCLDEAKRKYTKALGLKFIDYGCINEYEVQENKSKFYIKYAADIQNHDCDEVDLLKIFENNPELILDFDDKLKDWCLDDLQEWCNYLMDLGEI